MVLRGQLSHWPPGTKVPIRPRSPSVSQGRLLDTRSPIHLPCGPAAWQPPAALDRTVGSLPHTPGVQQCRVRDSQLTCHTLPALKSVTPAPGTLSRLSRQDQGDMGKEAETRAPSSSASPLSSRDLVRLCTPRALEGRLAL